MIWRIAMRNLIQHRTKTIIIGSLVALGIMLTLIGNCLITTMGSGITKSFTDNFTGEILVTASGAKAGVFGAQSDEMFGPPVISVLKDYDAALAKVKALPGLKSWTPQLSGYAVFNFEEKGSDFSLLFGIDPADYFKSMDNVNIISGRRLAPGEEGMMLNRKMQDSLKKSMSVNLKVGDTIQLNSFGDAGFKIREVPIVAIFEFKAANQRIFTPSFVDSTTLRVLLGKNVGPTEKVQVSKEATALIDANPDSLFGDDTTAAAQTVSGSGKVLTEQGLKTMLGGKVAASVPPPGGGAWNFILVRLNPGVKAEPLIKELNREFEKDGIKANAQGWQISGSPDSYTFAALGLIFNIAMILLAVVSIIIIMNTLVISVMERTSEIGTMRALGAQKMLVRKMFIAETLSVTVLFGLVGIVLGAIVVAILNVVGLPADSDFLAVIFGGKILKPVVSLKPLLTSMGLILLIGSVSWIYPVALALKVSPLKAITTD
jgi:putative ABC transport system permease protein